LHSNPYSKLEYGLGAQNKMPSKNRGSRGLEGAIRLDGTNQLAGDLQEYQIAMFSVNSFQRGTLPTISISSFQEIPGGQ